MTGPLRLPRHEAFVQHLVQGKTLTEAYELAGFRPSKKNAARLKARADVQARLAELQERAAEKVVVTVADIAAQLDEDRKFARDKENPSAAVSATMGKAKVLGLIVDRHAGPTGGAIPVTFDLSKLSMKDLKDLERIRSLAEPRSDQGGDSEAGSGI